AVADHYDRKPELGRHVREASKIIRLRSYNNWLKATLLQAYLFEGARVLDIGVGKGGDLTKYSLAGIGDLVAADVSSVSISQARDRYSALRGHRYPARFHVLDCFKESLEPFLTPDDAFDVVTSQFVIHYAFESERTVRIMLENVTRHLKPGGHFIGTVPNANWIVKKLRASPGLEFGNSIYSIRFDQKDEYPVFGHRYWFQLEDAIDDCAEYLIHFPTFERIALEYGLELQYLKTFHDFYLEHLEDEDSKRLMYRMNVFDENGQVPAEDWETIGVYSVFVMQK
ncbi:guanine-N(7)-methyltransferase domain-containing protein, partial [Hyaloraphidium curvatum]